MDDYISRQAAIDAIDCNITITGRQNAELVASTIGAFVDRIKALPSADVVQVVHGEWIPKDDESAYGLNCYCSKCGFRVLVNDAIEYSFCPNCVAKMDGEREE